MGDKEHRQTFDDLIFLGFRSPHYTQVPDELFDVLLPRLTGAEVKVLLYIVRRTFGFKKDSDRISLSQFGGGITRKTGKRLDSGTGLSSRAVRLALQSLVEKNILVKRRVTTKQNGHESTEYALNIVEKDPWVKSTQGPDAPSVKTTQAPLGAESTQGLDQKVPKPLGRGVPTQETVLQQTVNKNVNVRHLKKGDVDNFQDRRLPSVDDLATAMVLAQDIFEVFGDRKSREFYNYAAIKLVDHEQDVRFLLSTIKQDVVRNPNSKVQNPAALFVTQLKQLAQDRSVDL